MMRTRIDTARRLLLAAAALLLAAGPAVAQQSGGDSPPPEPTDEVDLVFEREVFVYPSRARPDPFTPLVNRAGLGPRFRALSLSGIIYAPGPAKSVVLLVDRAGRIHRVKQGGVIGNARVVSVRRRRVVFAVENYGQVEQRVLELEREALQGVQR